MKRNTSRGTAVTGVSDSCASREVRDAAINMAASLVTLKGMYGNS